MDSRTWTFDGEPLNNPPTVYKIATWVAMTDEQLADAPYLRAGMEYTFGEHAPLTIRERLTGYRHWTSKAGTTLIFAVGWRAFLYGWPSRIQRAIHDRVSPHGEYCPEPDDDD